MSRSKLKKRYNLDRNSIDSENYKKQRNICVNKKEYFNSFDVKNVTDNKRFWKTIRLRLSNKCKTGNTITLVENEKILQDENAIANTFKLFQ